MTFLPSDISNLEDWWHTDSLTPLADGTAVATWASTAGGKNVSFVQATGANQPKFYNNILGGKPILRFDGANDNMIATSCITAGTAHTRAYVMRQNSAVSATQKCGWTTDKDADQIYSLNSSDATQWIKYNATPAAVAITGDTAASFHYVVLVYNSLTSLDMYVDGGAAQNINPVDDFQLAVSLRLAMNWAGAFPCDCDWAEIIEYNKAVSGTELTNLRNYLAWKYFGVAATRDTTQHYVGVASAKITARTESTADQTATGVTVPNGSTVTGSAYIRCSADPTGGKAYVKLYDITNATVRGTANATSAANGAWERSTVSWTNSTGSDAVVVLRRGNDFNDSTADVWFDACQLELKTSAQPYCDGAQAACQWAGTAHNSTSQRVGIVIPAGLGGTYDVGVYAQWDGNATGGRRLQCYQNGNAMFPEDSRLSDGTGLLYQTSYAPIVLVAGDGLTLNANQGSGVGLNVVARMWIRKAD